MWQAFCVWKLKRVMAKMVIAEGRVLQLTKAMHRWSTRIQRERDRKWALKDATRR